MAKDCCLFNVRLPFVVSEQGCLVARTVEGSVCKIIVIGKAIEEGDVELNKTEEVAWVAGAAHVNVRPIIRQRYGRKRTNIIRDGRTIAINVWLLSMIA